MRILGGATVILLGVAAMLCGGTVLLMLGIIAILAGTILAINGIDRWSTRRWMKIASDAPADVADIAPAGGAKPSHLRLVYSDGRPLGYRPRRRMAKEH